MAKPSAIDSKNAGGIVAAFVGSDFEHECFFIAPIGEDGSEVRRRSDGVRDWIVRPAAKEAAGLETIRADDVGEPGQITAQAVQHTLKAKAAVADLTGGNPNVYYELSVRHGALLPVVLIAEKGTKLPFDISQSRVIFFDHTDLSDASRAKDELQSQIEASLTAPPDNPISDGMRLAQLQAGNVEEQTLAAVLDRLERVSQTTEQISRHLRRPRVVDYGPPGTSVLVGDPGPPFEQPGVHRVVTGTVGPEQREFEPPVFDPDDDLTPSEERELEHDARLGRSTTGDDPKPFTRP
jgi:hypothetical protein